MGRLQTARLENFIRRWGSIKGPGSVLSETLGDVFPILDLENLTPENQLVAGWSLVSGFATTIGVAAQTAAVQIANIAGSGLIAVVDKVIVNTQSASNVTWGLDARLLGAVINTQNRDGRQQQFSGGLRVRGSANISARTAGLIATVAGVDRELEVPNGVVVLSPGTQLTFVNSVVNDDIRVVFFGRVRIAEPSELSF